MLLVIKKSRKEGIYREIFRVLGKMESLKEYKVGTDYYIKLEEPSSRIKGEILKIRGVEVVE